MNITGKTILVTGGGSGIGFEIAKLLSNDNKVIITGRSEERLRNAAAKLNNVSYIAADVNSEADLKNIAQRLTNDFGGLDILINNAALIINRPFEEFSLGEYEDQIRVNSSAAFALARACAPGMKKKGQGRIVNFCSVTLNGRWEGYVPYVASKGAMLGLTKSLARELGPYGITVNAVSPGAVVSEAEERVFGERLEEYNDWILTNQSLKRRIEPQHIADLVLFLVSPASDMISGQNINIDGGW